MEKYENLGIVGEGSYGMVLKCRHRQSGQLVAIKKFLETKEDGIVRKIAMREIRLLKQLRHENLVNLIEVFCRKKHLYLVFEFVDHTVLDDLDQSPDGLDEDAVRRILWQVLKGIHFCHVHNIIHRDIKPENILVSSSGIIKLCDFGFARTLAKPGEIYTDYVATRWYRAPELLVGDTKYGRAVDVWAVGCLTAELLTGEPLFPGDSDVDQLFHIAKCLGNLSSRHLQIFCKNPSFERVQLPRVHDTEPLENRFTKQSKLVVDFMKQCLKLEPDDRPTCSHLLKHELFTADGFAASFTRQLRGIICREYESNPLTAQTMRHRYERCRQQLGLQPTGDHPQLTDNDDLRQRNKSTAQQSKPPRRLLPDPAKCTKRSSAASSAESPATGTTSGVALRHLSSNVTIAEREGVLRAENINLPDSPQCSSHVTCAPPQRGAAELSERQYSTLQAKTTHMPSVADRDAFMSSVRNTDNGCQDPMQAVANGFVSHSCKRSVVKVP